MTALISLAISLFLYLLLNIFLLMIVSRAGAINEADLYNFIDGRCSSEVLNYSFS